MPTHSIFSPLHKLFVPFALYGLVGSVLLPIEVYGELPLQTERFRVTNECPYPIWIEQDYTNLLPNDKIVELIPAPGGDTNYHDYKIPQGGLAATRFWAKAACNQYGWNCGIGESQGVTNINGKDLSNGHQTTRTGYDSAINSLFESTWGCLPGQVCANNPVDGKPLPAVTNWDASAVDGFTFPYNIYIKNDQGESCNAGDAAVKEIQCSGLDPAKCGLNDLSSGNNFNPINGVDVSKVNLQYLDYSGGTDTVGCFSPCKKMVGGQWQGWSKYLGNLNDHSNEAQMYCCPDGTVSPEECRKDGKMIAGKNVPAVAEFTQYVKTVHEVCDTYAYSFDDRVGLVNCDASVQYEMVFCPSGSKALPLPPQRQPRTFCDSTAIPKQLCYYPPSPDTQPCPNTTQACGTDPTMCKCPLRQPVLCAAAAAFGDDTSSSAVCGDESLPLTLGQGIATGLGREDKRAWITMTGTFIHDVGPDLDFGQSEIELKKILYEEGVESELVKKSGEEFLPWHLLPGKRSNATKGIYTNPTGSGPEMRMVIRNRDFHRGLYQFTLWMSRATIDIPQDCQFSHHGYAAYLTTEFEIVSNNVHAPVSAQTRWECQGRDPVNPSVLRAPRSRNKGRMNPDGR